MKHLLATLLLLVAAICHAQQPRIVKTMGTGSYANVHSALQDKHGAIWFGTTGEGLYLYNGKTFTNLTTKDGLPSNKIYPLLEDKQGNIWLATDIGLYRYSGKAYTRMPITSIRDAYIPVAATAAAAPVLPRCMLQAADGKIWIGTNKGIYIYNGSYFTHFAENDKVINPNKLQLIEVQSILQDKAGNIWFTTWFDGVCRFNGKTITEYKPNNEVWFSALLEDAKGNIWIGRRDKGAVI